MQVSRKSWHYRLMGLVGLDQPDNLCTYCWKTLFAIFMVGAIWPIAILGGLFVVTMPIWHMFINQDIAITVIAGFIATAEIVGLLILLRTIVSDRHEEEIYAGERERPKHGLAYAWIKAQHDKVCPLIKFD